ncbi:hypothetical protein HAX54_034304, partial [Datura stramonium]|nr:hypothetical protein [Datura stramonium]
FGARVRLSQSSRGSSTSWGLGFASLSRTSLGWFWLTGAGSISKSESRSRIPGSSSGFKSSEGSGLDGETAFGPQVEEGGGWGGRRKEASSGFGLRNHGRAK